MDVIGNLPNDPPHIDLPAIFDRIPSSDIYWLPMADYEGSCGVFVSLVTGAESDESSWRDIKAKLMDLNDWCWIRGERMARAFLGVEGKIDIRIFRVGEDVDGGRGGGSGEGQGQEGAGGISSQANDTTYLVNPGFRQIIGIGTS